MTVSPRSSAREFIVPPVDQPDIREHVRQLAEASASLFNGKINSTGSITFTASAASTVLTDLRGGVDSVYLLMPTTANAAAALTTTYVSSRGKQTATFTHANNSQTDRTYRYAVLA